MINITKSNGGWTAEIDGGIAFIPNNPENEQCREIMALIESGLVVLDPVAPPVPTAADVRAECARRMNALVALYSPEERETWPIQVAEAQAVLAGDTSGVVMLTALASARGLPLAVFAGAVLQTATATKTATAKLLAAQARILAMAKIPADYTADERWQS